MIRYCAYLSDRTACLRQTIRFDVADEAEAVEYARTLIVTGGRVEVWSPGMHINSLIGSDLFSGGPLVTAMVRPARCQPGDR